MITVTPTIAIDEGEIKERFIRSPGPGGQKVNKSESAVQLRFNAQQSPGLSKAVFQRLKALAGRRMNRQGIIVITANRFRFQERNRQDALDRLIELIKKAAIEPKRRKPTKPSQRSNQRRLDTKRRQGDVKKGRGMVDEDD
mgnify:CR=1 FL=1